MSNARFHAVRRVRRVGRPVLVEELESRRLLSAAPIGSVDIYNRSTIAGWAYDASDGANSIAVDIEINGAVTTITANGARADLVGAVGSRYHGFTFSVPTLNPGTETVLVYARASDGTRTLLRGGTLPNPAPAGWIEAINSTGIYGWTVDTDDRTAALQVRVDVDGVTGTPVTANATRNDLIPLYGSSNHGIVIPGSFLGHVVDVYVQDIPSNTWVLFKSTGHAPVGNVELMNAHTVAGWAFDSDLGSAPTEVRVDIDGVAGTPVDASNARSDLARIFGSANHGFSISLPALSPGAHTVAVYAIDTASTSVAPVRLAQGTVTNAPPHGYVDALSATSVSGWAFDPDAGASSINVTVYVDRAVFATVSANTYRRDLVTALGSGNHGFSVDLSSLTKTSHAITVTMHDSAGGSPDEIVLFDGYINNHVPFGFVDSASSRTVAGWAYDPDAGVNPSNVDVYIDGTFALTAIANVARADLTHAIGSPNHGYSIALPAMEFGTHVITVYADESVGNNSVLIGTATVVNHVPIGSADLFNRNTVSGWAFDADWGSGAVTVDLFVDGVDTTSVTANGTRNDLTPVFGSPNHGFTVSVPTLSAGSHEVSVFIVDPNNSRLVPLATRTFVV